MTTATPTTLPRACPRCQADVTYRAETGLWTCARCGYTRQTMQPAAQDLVVAAPNGVAVADDDRWLSVQELAAHFGVHFTSISMWAQRDHLEYRAAPENRQKRLYRLADIERARPTPGKRGPKTRGTTVPTVQEPTPIRPRPRPAQPAVSPDVHQAVVAALDQAERETAAATRRADHFARALAAIATASWRPGGSIRAAHELVALARIAIEEDAVGSDGTSLGLPDTPAHEEKD